MKTMGEMPVNYRLNDKIRAFQDAFLYFLEVSASIKPTLSLEDDFYLQRANFNSFGVGESGVRK